MWRKCRKQREYHQRTVHVGKLPLHHQQSATDYPANAIRNQKYSVISFIPKVGILYNYTHCKLMMMHLNYHEKPEM